MHFFAIEADIQQANAKLPLRVRQCPRYRSVVFLAPCHFLDIKIKKLAVGGECDKVDGRLFGDWLEHIASVAH